MLLIFRYMYWSGSIISGSFAVTMGMDVEVNEAAALPLLEAAVADALQDIRDFFEAP